MTETEVILQQLITGLTNGTIIALIALGYTMVYGIIELINFAHGELFMLGAMFALTLLGAMGVNGESYLALGVLLLSVPVFCGIVNVAVERFAYRPLRTAPRLAPLVSAIGVSFIFLNIGLLWGGLPMDVFNQGRSASAPKDFPSLVPWANLLGDSAVQISLRDLTVLLITIPLLIGLTLFVKHSKMGKAMRAVAQNPQAATLMGIDSNRVISTTFFIGGALAGVASVIYGLYNNTVFFQMGYRVGIDAFTAAVVGGIGNFAGAMLGAILIGLVRAFSDQYFETAWTNVVVFAILVVVLVFRPSGLLGSTVKEKV